jgi:hypothetical protein
MILPVLAAIAVRALISYAIKEGIEYVVDKARDAVVQEIMKKARAYAEKMLLDHVRETCPKCDAADVLRKMNDPCSILSRGKGKGKYRGGSDEEMTKPVGDGKDSHHMPAKANYPSWPKPQSTYKKWPAIQMDPADHKKTFSNGSNPLSGAYARAQKYAFKEYGLLGAFALDVADIKMNTPKGKYDEALMEAAAYAACVAAFPDKYDTRPAKAGGRRKK